MTINNGDFETGDLTGWSLYNSNNTVPPGLVTVDAAYSGSYGLRTTNNCVAGKVYSEFNYSSSYSTVTEGAIAAEFWYRFVSKNTTNSDVRITVYLRSDGSGYTEVLRILCNGTFDTDWHKVSIPYNTTNFHGPGEYQFIIQGSGYGNTRTLIVDFDDFNFTEKPPFKSITSSFNVDPPYTKDINTKYNVIMAKKAITSLYTIGSWWDILNGGFETGNLNGWSTWGYADPNAGQAIVAVNSASKYSGNYGCQIHVHGGNINSNGSFVYLEQPFDWGKFYCGSSLIGYLSFRLNITDSSYDQGSGCSLVLNLYGGTTQTWNNETSGWEQIILYPTIYDYYISLKMDCDYYHVMDAYVDEFDFVTNKKSLTSSYWLVNSTKSITSSYDINVPVIIDLISKYTIRHPIHSDFVVVIGV